MYPQTDTQKWLKPHDRHSIIEPLGCITLFQFCANILFLFLFFGFPFVCFYQEFDAEKQRYSREKELLLNKAEEHRMKARKFAEELSSLKQNHVQTKQEVRMCTEKLLMCT